MTLIDLLAISGAVAWLFAAWRMVRLVKTFRHGLVGLKQRVCWALWGHARSPYRRQF